MKKLFVLTLAVLLLMACTRQTNQAYLQAAQTAVANYNLAVEALDARIEAFNSDQQLLHDPAWAAESLQVLAELQTAGEAFRSLPEATSDLAELDRLLKLVADETDLYVDTMTTSINALDENGVEVARSHRSTIGQYIEQAKSELNKLLGSQ